jgi:hypothetical protein
VGPAARSNRENCQDERRNTSEAKGDGVEARSRQLVSWYPEGYDEAQGGARTAARRAQQGKHYLPLRGQLPSRPFSLRRRSRSHHWLLHHTVRLEATKAPVAAADTKMACSFFIHDLLVEPLAAVSIQYVRVLHVT